MYFSSEDFEKWTIRNEKGELIGFKEGTPQRIIDEWNAHLEFIKEHPTAK